MDTDKTPNQLYNKSNTNLVSKAAGKYQSQDRAKSFATTVPGTRTDRLEKRCIKKAMSFLKMPAGTAVLDIPCGAGRIQPILKQDGFQVTGADISASMLEQAKNSGYDELKIADVFETGFADKQFDLVVSHRLFQYFSEAADRRRALSELHRISKGPIIVSFSCDCAFDALMYKIRRFFGITRLRSCQPVSFTDFAQDAHSVGLEVVKWLATRPLISKRWYAIMKPRTAVNAGSDKKASFVGDILRPLLLRTGIVTAIITLLIVALNLFMHSFQNYKFQQVVDSYVHDDDRLYVVAGLQMQPVVSDIGAILCDEQLNIRDVIQTDRNLNKNSLFLLPLHYTEYINRELSSELKFIKKVEFEDNSFALFSTEKGVLVTD